MLTIPGYQILALIYESANSLVYRGRREHDNQPVILKLLKHEYPSAAELARYEQEYEITRSLNLEGVVKAYDLLKYQNTSVMVLEDFGGESLRTLMASQRFTLLGFLTLAVKVAKSLGNLHAVNIIHKDINPSNISFNPATEQLKIIDFSISTVLSRESTAIKNPSVLEGTLAYMSPEQTGRMNRSLDYRTDFYSLGATFYELLTHQLPFIATDAMELVHCHIAKQPVPPHVINPEIPKVLSDIVMKLLAKTADKRYQSAWGLIADLEECLTQLQDKGTISEFPIGRQDISDKFQIPSKLYGREREIETLLMAFERVYAGTTELMLVSGYSGIGKSALVQVLYKPITRRKGYFIAGKFDQFQRNIPYSAVVSAFSELVRQLLTESEVQLNRWREKLLAAFGPNGQIIIDVIPEVELIVGSQPAIAELGPTESQNRFNLVFQNFIQVFCSREHPLVIFLDDLQWADSATLKLIELMLMDEGTQYLFVIGAYRDNEVSPTHPLMMTLDTLRHEEAVINQLSLEPLNLEQISLLIAETLHSNEQAVKPLAELVVRKTQGNPFFVSEFLKTLYQENLLTFNPPSPVSKGGWQWNMDKIEALAITDNVVELMIWKLKKLPDSTQQVLRLVACLGNQFDLNTLSLIHKKEASETFKDLWPAVQEGLILPASELENTDLDLINYPLLILNYKFLHDRVQQAAYSLIDESNKKVVHLEIGRLLLANTPAEYRTERIFELVDHLNVARSLIADEQEQIELAVLNLEAARKAKDATAYVSAQQYLTAGMESLSEAIWESHYDLAFALHKERADIEYLNGNFEESERFINLTLENTHSALEKAEIYNLLIVQYTLRAKYEEGATAAKKALALLGIELPADNLETAIGGEIAAAKESVANKNIASLVDAPEMTLPDKRIAIKLISNALTSFYLTNLEFWTLSLLKAVNMSFQYGNAPESCLCYSSYGMLLIGFFGDYKSAYEFGNLGRKLSEKWSTTDLRCKVLATFGNAVNYWFKHIKEANPINNEGYQAALNSGCLEYAGYLLHNKIVNLFMEGSNIAQILTEIPKYLQFAQKTKNQLSTDTLIGMQLLMMKLTKLAQEEAASASDEMSEVSYLEDCQQRSNFLSLAIYKIYKLQILYLYDHLDEAVKIVSETEKLIPFTGGMAVATDYNFYSSLILIAAGSKESEDEQKQYWQKLEANQQQMKTWAENCPENFLHKYLLVEAEIARISGKAEEAIDLYDQAIESALENQFTQNEALANELAAKFWLAKGKEKIAKIYMTEAHYGYQRWGAKRKVEDLETKYSQLLTKTPAKNRMRDTANSKLDATIHTTTGGNSESLDLVTVMKASQAISGEIVLDKLLAKLMKILIENAGAQKGLLVLPKDGKLIVVAEASVTQDEVVMQKSNLVESSQDLPVSVINYVERTRSDMVLSNAAGEGRFTSDPYIAKRQLKSVLCSPIINQGQLIGILYLENNLTSGAFTPERLEVLRLLSSQAAVSLENALLYASVEQKVSDRTQELNEKNVRLEQTLHELKRTQTKLIQSEKMSSLGQMVAGVAHEINNPVSFIYGNLTPASEYVQSLLSVIHLYQQHYPTPAAEICEEIENIDLEFVVEDLQKLLDSMKVGAERIRKIVLSLRNFSRLDEADMKPVDIHQGIESTLLILQPRLRKEGGRSGIEIIKEYGKLPLITCYASQMNQVFMNILSNAIDALESFVPRSESLENERDGKTIYIRTEASSTGFATIRISDNGPGLTEDVIRKIFDPFFTTKPVGSGTGLGLSISYQIVVDSHQGQLNCISTPGKGAEFVISIPIKPQK
ncbi:ATP-binding sensor histidine kinase [Microcoleus sp. FACHB-68]|uniref:trifunctional serine/threonine-protein kinase/ATP-binding protein/sensor histidine kinase n=1 Tax=Microcoleus sp. FACHB-68 TaxID=2692826 RepID=UPI001686DF05|nr:ATP-binding sensor histidine kinase [Microcoleus sp. FACHB-68]MBD1939865.1 AAA family ATPase [Microcoleus sp. FACHB-68]